MQMQKIKKVASGAIGLFLTGATLMGPALAADLSDFQSMGPSDTMVVVGANAITADVVGGINIGGKLAQSGIESATCSVTCEDTGTAQVTDGVKIETSSKKLYLGTANARTDTLREVKSTLSENDLNLLAKQTITYEDGSTSTMNQVMDLTDNTEIRFSEDDATGETDTPRLILYNAGSSILYNLTLTFPTGLDIQDPDNTTTAGPGIAGQDITIMGKTFTVGVQNDISTTKLVLFGGGEEKALVAAGDAVSFELEGETHTIRMTSWTGTGATLKGVFELDGVSYTKSANSAITIDPETNSQITIKKVEETKVPSIAGGAATEGAQATIFVGSAKLTLENGQEVKKGDDAIAGAAAAFSSSGTKINKVEISYTPDEDVTAEAGAAYVDPVLGAFDFVLTGLTPDLKASSRDKVAVVKNGKKIKLTVPTKDGNTISINVLTAQATGGFRPEVDGKKLFVTDTQAGITTTNYLFVSDGEYSNVLQFTSMDKSDNILTLKDVGSGENVEVSYSSCTGGSGTIQTGCSGTMYIGGTSYAVTAVTEVAKTFALDAYSGATYAGNVPLISRNGANVTLVTGTTGVTVDRGVFTVSEVDTTETEADGTGVVMQINTTTKLSTDEVDTVDIVANQPTLNSIGDGDVSTGLTSYGTLIEDNTDSDTLSFWYPDEQAYANVYVMKNAVNPPSVGVSGTTQTQTVSIEAPSLGNGIAKLDSAVSAADKEAKNLVLVGGPAANNLVKDLAAEGSTPDLAYWTENLKGKFILQAIDDAFATGKTAIVVAGWAAEDTQAASLKIATEAVSGAAVSCLGTTCTDLVFPPEVVEEEVVEEEAAEEVTE